MLLDLLRVIRLIIGFPALPERPDDVEPAVGQAAIGVAFGVPAGATLRVVSGGPISLAHGGLGKLLRRLPIRALAGAAKTDLVAFAALVRHGARAGEGLDDRRVRIAFAAVAKHDEELWGEQGAGTR